MTSHYPNFTETLNHSFTTTKSSLSSSEVSLLTCSATIHYPPLTSISIVKNKILLKTTADTLLTVSTDSLRVSPFGSYQCRVNATGVVFTQQLTIKEKGMCMFVMITVNNFLSYSFFEARAQLQRVFEVQ